MIEYFAENLWQMWSLIAVICLILEITNGDFYLMCFAIGGILTAIITVTGLEFYAQLLLFSIFSVACIFFVRPVVIKYLHTKDSYRPSNADAIIGRYGHVSQTIVENGYGRVAIDGDDWKAISADNKSIEQGQKVKVLSRDSIIITVEQA